MAKPLVVVESPAKAKTISKFLGDDYDVRASVGHVADLPSKGLNIDVDNGFKPTYELTDRGKTVVKELRAALKNASELYLATDEDREGEAISWHLVEHLKPKVPVKRMVFHEITKTAIDHAIDNPRGIDYGLVDAAETRRILDRLYGYEVSPVLWRRVNRGLSAGRVQSPSIRLIVERERERIAFVAAGCQARRGRRRQGREREGFRRPRADQVDGEWHGRRRRRGTGTSARRRSRIGDVLGAIGRGEAVPFQPEAALHDVDPPAGGRPQAAPVVVAGDAGGPGPVRAGIHHVHANRQRHAVGRGDVGDTRRGHVRRRSRRTPRRHTRPSVRSRPTARRSRSRPS